MSLIIDIALWIITVALGFAVLLRSRPLFKQSLRFGGQDFLALAMLPPLVHEISDDQHDHRQRDRAVAQDQLLVLFEKCYGVLYFEGKLICFKLFTGDSSHENLR